MRLQNYQTWSLSLRPHWPMALILAAYLLIGLLYAVETPRWQVPDEPAHYNYIRSLVEGPGLPVMEFGDYDQQALEFLTAERFPPGISTEILEYEDHQPPLYYLLAAPVYWLTQGSLIALRLFSLLLGGIVVAMAFAIGLELFPQHPGLAWLAAGLVAFVPQHTAMMAGVNNDALTEALLALWLWLALRYLRGKMPAFVLGLGLGALLLTKTTGYGALPLAALAVLLRWRRSGLSWRRAVQHAALIFAPGLLLGSLWWGRNIGVYGWPDWMGLIQHNLVVVGQPRTEDWLARDGFFPFLAGAMRTTFRSFWGQFGWMGVVLDTRLYLAAGLFSVLASWGAAWQLADVLRAGQLEARHRDGLVLLGASVFITAGMFFFYNLTFVQHQGRYLFPALPAMALAWAVGLRRLMERRLAIITALLLTLALLVAGVVGLLQGDLPVWTLTLFAAAAGAVAGGAMLRAYWRPFYATVLLLALAALEVFCLFGFIVPQLRR